MESCTPESCEKLCATFVLQGSNFLTLHVVTTPTLSDALLYENILPSIFLTTLFFFFVSGEPLLGCWVHFCGKSSWLKSVAFGNQFFGEK